jgi:hypothetical protein
MFRSMVFVLRETEKMIAQRLEDFGLLNSRASSLFFHHVIAELVLHYLLRAWNLCMEKKKKKKRWQLAKDLWRLVRINLDPWIKDL